MARMSGRWMVNYKLIFACSVLSMYFKPIGGLLLPLFGALQLP